MSLSPEALAAFIEAYRLDCGVVLSEEGACGKAEQLYSLVKSLYVPLQKAEYETAKRRIEEIRKSYLKKGKLL